MTSVFSDEERETITDLNHTIICPGPDQRSVELISTKIVVVDVISCPDSARLAAPRVSPPMRAQLGRAFSQWEAGARDMNCSPARALVSSECPTAAEQTQSSPHVPLVTTPWHYSDTRSSCTGATCHSLNPRHQRQHPRMSPSRRSLWSRLPSPLWT